MSVPLDPSNITLLADTLQRLHVVQQEQQQLKPDATEASEHPTQQSDTMSVPRTPISRDGYGFRRSGISTPQIGHDGQRESQISQDLLVPDPNGLGWPGMFVMTTSVSPWGRRDLRKRCPFLPTAKSTVSRLNATPEEKAARDAKMAAAVRMILECIGEDPNREGLLRTPDRYAKALLWMTRGYEERLAGALDISRSSLVHLAHICLQML